MANTFKNAFSANVSNSSYADVYTVPAATTTVVLGLNICNKTASAVTAKVQLQDTSASSATFQIIEDVSFYTSAMRLSVPVHKYFLVVLSTHNYVRYSNGRKHCTIVPPNTTGTI